MIRIRSFATSLVADLLLSVFIPRRLNAYITCTGKQDGMGAQVHAIFSGLLYAEMTNITYVHTPLAIVSHNFDGDENFAQHIESYFGLDQIAPAPEGVNLTVVALDNLSACLGYVFSGEPFRAGRKVLFQKPTYHNFADRHPDRYKQIQPLLRKRFYAQPKNYPLHGNRNVLTVAVHIRRGDVKESSVRYTETPELISRLEQLANALQHLRIPYEIHCYSLGSPEEFEKFHDLAVLHLNGNAFEDFYNLVRADILIMAKSSFSYVAALLSDGIIVYEKFWHAPMTDWTVCRDGSFAKPGFYKRLKEYASHRGIMSTA